MSNAKIHPELPVPDFFEPGNVSRVWRVPYAERAEQARAWAKTHQLLPKAKDRFKIALVLIDVQNTFCIPDFELYVGGRSGTGAVDDNIRLVRFIYRNLGAITEIFLTLDTHQATQIFHPIFLVNQRGDHPAPYSLISAGDIQEGRWIFNPILAEDLGVPVERGQDLLQHYTSQLAKKEKFDLTIWPYHAMLGGIGHALVASIEESVFFHTISRYSRPDFEIKGTHAFTEHYSAIGPEVLKGPDGNQLAEKSDKILSKVRDFDIVIIAGQAKSHCVAWTVNDLIEQIMATDPNLLRKVYLLEDCTSPVVVPGAIDYTEQSDADFARFAEDGLHIVRSTEAISSWAGINQ
jgi:nicotinamidase-related amidase